MARWESQDSFRSVLGRMNGRILGSETAIASLTPQVYTGLSVSSVSVSSGPKTILTTTINVLEESLLEVYVRARGTIGSGKVLRMNAYLDGTDLGQLIAWTGAVTNQVRRTAHGTDIGQVDSYPTAKGGFIILDDFSGNEVTAGEHTLRFDVYTNDSGASTTGSVGATIAARLV